MPSLKSSVPRTRDRKRLTSPGKVLFTGAAVAVLMVFLFPRATWFRQLSAGADKERGDSLRIVLLRGLMNQGQTGLSVREDYSRQLGLMGNYRQAFEFLDSILPSAPADSMIALRRLEAELAQQSLAAHPARALDALARFHRDRALESLLNLPLMPTTLAWAAEMAKTSGRPDLAARAYMMLAEKDVPQASEWYRQAARLAMGQGNYLLSSNLYFLAEDSSRNLADKRACFLEGLRTLQAANRLDLALSQAGLRIEGLRGDSEVLLFLVKMARSANQPKEAEKYARMLVRSEPPRGSRR